MAEKKETAGRFELIEVPTEMGLAIKDNSENVNLTDTELLVQIANKLDNIEKAVKG